MHQYCYSFFLFYKSTTIPLILHIISVFVQDEEYDKTLQKYNLFPTPQKEF